MYSWNDFKPMQVGVYDGTILNQYNLDFTLGSSLYYCFWFKIPQKIHFSSYYYGVILHQLAK